MIPVDIGADEFPAMREMPVMPLSEMAQRIAALAAHQREHAAPVPLTVPASEPRLTAKDMAAGEVA